MNRQRPPHPNNTVYPVSDLSVLAVSGSDAAQFLQGQSTCDIKQINDTIGSFGAFCTPKGRTVCTFFIVKHQQAFLLIVASDLLTKIQKRLQLYVLRSDVQLLDNRADYRLIGLSCADPLAAGITPPERLYAVSQNQPGLCISLSAAKHRFLCVVPTASADQLQAELVNSAGFASGDAADWQYSDIMAGIPWLNAATSELFTPHMINLDQLSGISFNKGCYTGQEIVARTHYLGKAKRKMYLAECSTASLPQPGEAIVDSSTGSPQSIGTVITACHQSGKIVMLLVLPIDHAASTDLGLANQPEHAISVTELSY